MHEKIADIQNSFWKAYKNFRQTMDANQWAVEVGEILDRYKNDKQYFYMFCECQFSGWSAVLSAMRVLEREGVGKKNE